jgi:hypothetical protein
MMNRLSTQGFAAQTREARGSEVSSTSMIELPEVNQRERLLAHRLEQAKERLVSDLGKLSAMVGSTAVTVSKKLVRAGMLLGGLVLLGIVSAVMRRRRRLRVRFL